MELHALAREAGERQQLTDHRFMRDGNLVNRDRRRIVGFCPHAVWDRQKGQIQRERSFDVVTDDLPYVLLPK